jgi:hypothetical protein
MLLIKRYASDYGFGKEKLEGHFWRGQKDYQCKGPANQPERSAGFWERLGTHPVYAFGITAYLYLADPPETGR